MKKHRSRTALAALKVAVAASLSFPAAPLRADSEEPAYLNMSVEQLLQIPVDSVSPVARSTMASPATVTLITREQIRRYGYRTLSEALRRVSGIVTTTNRRYDFIGVRGAQIPGDYNERVLVMIDGQRVNDWSYDQSFIGEEFDVDIENVERIEVVKGPGSATWGTNALFAVINVITRSGKDIQGQRVLGTYGTHDRRKILAEAGNVTDGGLEYAMSYGGFASAGDPDIYYQEWDHPETNNGIAEADNGERGHRGYAKLRYGDFSFEAVSRFRNVRDPNGDAGTLFNDKGTYVEDSALLLNAGYRHVLVPESNGTVTGHLYFDRNRYEGDFAFRYEPDDPVIAYNRDGALSQSVGGDLQYSQNLSESTSVAVGGEYRRVYKNRIFNFDRAPEFVPYTDIDEPFYILSAYGEVTQKLTEKLTLILGGRLDEVSPVDLAASPRSGLLYQWTDDVAFKLLYSNAFRAPNNAEQNFVDNDVYIANHELNSEKLDYYEFVVEQKIGDVAQLTSSLYHYQLRDIIADRETDDGHIQSQNVGSLDASGFDSQLVVHLTGGLSSYGGFSFNEADLSDTIGAPNAPRWQVNGGISVPVLGEALYVSPEFRYIAASRDESGASLRDYTVANVALLAPHVWKGLTLSLGIYNVFHEQYFRAGNTGDVRVPQEGRTVQFLAEYRF